MSPWRELGASVRSISCALRRTARSAYVSVTRTSMDPAECELHAHAVLAAAHPTKFSGSSVERYKEAQRIVFEQARKTIIACSSRGDEDDDEGAAAAHQPALSPLISPKDGGGGGARC